jgi:hypothetical protein
MKELYRKPDGKKSEQKDFSAEEASDIIGPHPEQ